MIDAVDGIRIKFRECDVRELIVNLRRKTQSINSIGCILCYRMQLRMMSYKRTDLGYLQDVLQ